MGMVHPPPTSAHAQIGTMSTPQAHHQATRHLVQHLALAPAPGLIVTHIHAMAGAGAVGAGTVGEEVVVEEDTTGDLTSSNCDTRGRRLGVQVEV